MKTKLTSPFALIVIGFILGSLAALAEPAGNGTPSTSRHYRSKVTVRTAKPILRSTYTAFPHGKVTSRTNLESGFTTGVGTNPADHGINNSTATHPGDNGLGTKGSSNDIKGTSTATPPVNSADQNNKAGTGLSAATEKKGR